jgi:hypothetical protein
MLDTFKVGVVGYSQQLFDRQIATWCLIEAFAEIEIIFAQISFPGQQIEVVSGLTNLGIPGLAYELVSQRKYLTTGFACKTALSMQDIWYPVNHKIVLIGNSWGDESEEFVKYINTGALIRVGGGKQSLAEVKLFDQFDGYLFEYDLESIQSAT